MASDCCRQGRLDGAAPTPAAVLITTGAGVVALGRTDLTSIAICRREYPRIAVRQKPILAVSGPAPPVMTEGARRGR